MFTMPPVNIFGALTEHWFAIASSPRSRAAFKSWAQRRPPLAGYDSPADVVAEINRPGHPDLSCALLADLLVVADDEPLAQLAVLQALIPGLRRAVHQRWNTAATTGPWRAQGDLASDAVSAAWEIIRHHAGADHPLPARLITRRVERHLRTLHQQQLRAANSTDGPDAHGTTSQADHDDSDHATIRIAGAARAGHMDRTAAVVAFGVAVAGESPTAVAKHLGLSPSALQQALRQSHHIVAGRRSTSGSPSPSNGRRFPISQESFPMLPLLLTVNQAAELLGLGRTTLYDLIATGELHSVSRGASRRIPLWSIYDYLDRLCECRYRTIPLPAVIDYFVRASDQEEAGRG